MTLNWPPNWVLRKILGPEMAKIPHHSPDIDIVRPYLRCENSPKMFPLDVILLAKFRPNKYWYAQALNALNCMILVVILDILCSVLWYKTGRVLNEEICMKKWFFRTFTASVIRNDIKRFELIVLIKHCCINYNLEKIIIWRGAIMLSWL